MTSIEVKLHNIYIIQVVDTPIGIKTSPVQSSHQQTKFKVIIAVKEIQGTRF